MIMCLMVITGLPLETDIRLSERKWQQLKSLLKDRSGGGATGLLGPRRGIGAAACDLVAGGRSEVA